MEMPALPPTLGMEEHTTNVPSVSGQLEPLSAIIQQLIQIDNGNKANIKFEGVFTRSFPVFQISTAVFIFIPYYSLVLTAQ